MCLVYGRESCHFKDWHFYLCFVFTSKPHSDIQCKGNSTFLVQSLTGWCDCLSSSEVSSRSLPPGCDWHFFLYFNLVLIRSLIMAPLSWVWFSAESWRTKPSDWQHKLMCTALWWSPRQFLNGRLGRSWGQHFERNENLVKHGQTRQKLSDRSTPAMFQHTSPVLCLSGQLLSLDCLAMTYHHFLWAFPPANHFPSISRPQTHSPRQYKLVGWSHPLTLSSYNNRLYYLFDSGPKYSDECGRILGTGTSDSSQSTFWR